MKKRPQHGGKREGAGRPRKYDKSARISVVVPADLLGKIDRLAEKQGGTRSEVIVSALSSALH